MLIINFELEIYVRLLLDPQLLASAVHRPQTVGISWFVLDNSFALEGKLGAQNSAFLWKVRVFRYAA